ncbi:hypothetical protein quinque_013423 [Culex quinquefasciatus]
MQQPEDQHHIKEIEQQLIQLQSAFQLLNDKNHQLSSQLVTLRHKKVKREAGEDDPYEAKFTPFDTKRIKAEFGRPERNVKTEQLETIVLDDDDDSRDHDDSMKKLNDSRSAIEPVNYESKDSELAQVTEDFKKLVNKLETAQRRQHAEDQELGRQLQHERSQNKLLEQQVQDLTEENLRLMVEQTNVKAQLGEHEKQIERLKQELTGLYAEKTQQMSLWQADKSCFETQNTELNLQLQRKISDSEEVRSQNQVLEQQLQECRSHLTATENRLTEYETQIVRLNEELAVLRSDKQQQINSIEEEKAKLETMGKRLTEYEADITRLNEELVLLNADKNQQMSLWEEEKANLDNRNANLQNHLQKKIDEDQQLLNEQNQTLEVLKQQLQTMTTDNDRLKVDQESVRLELVAAENRAMECEKQIQRLNQELAEQITDKNQLMSAWEQEKSSLESAIKYQQQQLQLKDGDNEEINKLLFEERNQKKIVEQQLLVLSEEKEQLKSQLETTQNNLSEHEKLIESLKQELVELVDTQNQQANLWKEETTNLEAKNQELLLQLQGADEENRAIKQQLQDLNDENDHLKDEQQNTKSQLAIAEETVVEHAEQINRLEQELEEVLAENNQQISLWEQMKTCLEDKIDDLRVQLQKKDAHCAELSHLLEEERNQRSTLEQQLQSMQEEREELKSQLATTKITVEEHAERIARLEQELEELGADKDQTMHLWEEEKSVLETTGQELHLQLQSKLAEIGDMGELLLVERKQNKDLEQQLLAMSEDNIAMEKRMTDFEFQIKALEQELEEARAEKEQKMSLWEGEKAELEGKTNDLLLQMEKKCGDNKELAELLQEEKTRSGDLDQQLLSTNEKLEQLKTQFEGAETRLIEQEENIKKLEQQLADLNADKEQAANLWNEERSNLETKNEELENQLKQKDNENGELNELLLVERNQNKAQGQQLIAMTEEKEELKSLLVTMENSMTQYETQIKELKHEMAEFVAERNQQTKLWIEEKAALETDNKELQQQLQKKDADNKELSKLFLEEQINSKDLAQQLLVLSEDKVELNSRLATQGSRLLEHEEKIRRLEHELSELLADRNQQLSAWATEKTDLEGKTKQLNEQLQKKDEEMKDLSELLLEERNHNIDLEQQLQDAGKANENAKAQLKGAEKSLAKQEKKVKQLKQELEDLQVDKSQQAEVSRMEKEELESKNKDMHGMMRRLKDLVRNVDKESIESVTCIGSKKQYQPIMSNELDISIKKALESALEMLQQKENTEDFNLKAENDKLRSVQEFQQARMLALELKSVEQSNRIEQLETIVGYLEKNVKLGSVFKKKEAIKGDEIVEQLEKLRTESDTEVEQGLKDEELKQKLQELAKENTKLKQQLDVKTNAVKQLSLEKTKADAKAKELGQTILQMQKTITAKNELLKTPKQNLEQTIVDQKEKIACLEAKLHAKEQSNQAVKENCLTAQKKHAALALQLKELHMKLANIQGSCKEVAYK